MFFALGRNVLLTRAIRICLLTAITTALAVPASAQSPQSSSNEHFPSPTNPPGFPLAGSLTLDPEPKSGSKAIGAFLGAFKPTIDGFPTALASATGSPTSDLGMTSFDPNALHLVTPGVSGPTLFTRQIASTTTNAASGIAIDFNTGGAGQPTVFISDAANAEIDVYDGSGTYLYSFPLAGGFFAEGCTFNPITGHIYVVDIGTPDVIRRYTPSGTLVQTYPLSGAPVHSTDGLAFDNKRNVFWVFNRVADIVQCYDTSFNLETSFSPNVVGLTGARGEGIGAIGDVLYIASWTTGNILSFDISTATQPTCSSFRAFVQAEWPLLQADLDLPGIHTPATPGRRIPERYALGMIEAIFCLDGHQDFDRAVQAYEINLAALRLEDEPQLSRVAPYKHVLAAILMISQERQDYFAMELGLENAYVTALRSGAKTADEPFSDEGDLDSDGVTNGDEYDNVIASGGAMNAFLVAVLNPSLMGAPLSALDTTFLALLVFLFVALGTLLHRHRTHAKSPQAH